MKNNTPDLFKRAATALSVTDWLALILTGKKVSERSQAGEWSAPRPEPDEKKLVELSQNKRPSITS